MMTYASGEWGDAPTSDDDLDLNEPERVRFLYSLPMALWLWSCFRDHGSMPRAGGLLDQPHGWYEMIQFLNRRYMRARERTRPRKGGDEGDDTMKPLHETEYWGEMSGGAADWLDTIE